MDPRSASGSSAARGQHAAISGGGSGEVSFSSSSSSGTGGPPQADRSVSGSGGAKIVHSRTRSAGGGGVVDAGGNGSHATTAAASTVVERVRRFSVFTVPQALELPSPSSAGADGASGGSGSHHHHSQLQQQLLLQQQQHHHHQLHHHVYHREQSHDYGGGGGVKIKEGDSAADETAAGTSTATLAAPAPTPAPAMLEARIESPDGRYIRLNDEIGRGSFKTVYKGLDSQTGMAVAWCELLDRGWSAEERQKYREEVEMLKALHHPNILQFYESWSYTNGLHKNTVLVTELMSGTLKSYIRLFQKVSMPVLVSWCHQILCGLHFLHSRTPPIIHRDLKCDNIFVIDITGVVKIGDLGLAKLKSAAFVKSVIGTPEFMAPEMYEENYDEAVDVYAFGMCMLEMATCEYPYKECTNAMQIIRKVSNGVRPESVERIENQDVHDIVIECIQVDKTKRPTVAELLRRPFFAPERDMMVELCDAPHDGDARSPPRQQLGSTEPQSVTLSLRFGPRKRRGAHNRNEAVQFEFQLNHDSVESVVQDLLSSGLIYDEDVEQAEALISERLESVRAAHAPSSEAVEQPESFLLADIDYEGAEDLKYKHSLELAILREHQLAEVDARASASATDLGAAAAETESAATAAHGGYQLDGGNCRWPFGSAPAAAIIARSEVLSCRCLVSRCDEHVGCLLAGWQAAPGRGPGAQLTATAADDACAAATASVRAVQRALRGGCRTHAEEDAPASSPDNDETGGARRRAASLAAGDGPAADRVAAYAKWYLRSGLPYEPATAAAAGRRKQSGHDATSAAAGGPQQLQQQLQPPGGDIISRVVRSVISVNDDDSTCGRGGGRQSPQPISPEAGCAAVMTCVATRPLGRERPGSFSGGAQRTAAPVRPSTLDLDSNIGASRAATATDRFPSPSQLTPSGNAPRPPGAWGSGAPSAADEDATVLRQTRAAAAASSRASQQTVARKVAVQKALQESLLQVQSALRHKSIR